MQASFLPLTADDVEAVLPLMSHLYAEDAGAWSENHARQAIAALLRAPDFGGIWLIQAGTETVGYLVLTIGFSLEFHGRFVLLDELFVVEPWRGRGIGAQALDFAFGQCRRWHVDAIRLEVAHANSRAQALYRHHGFQVHQRHLMTRYITG